MLIALALVGSAYAAAPPVLTHQGRLLDAQGTPIDGPVDLRVTLFDTAASPDGFWTKAYPVYPVEDGYYAVSLVTDDVGVPLDPADFADGETWVGVAVAGSAVGPRTQLGSVPYALAAGNGGVVSTTSATCTQAGQVAWNPDTNSLVVCNGRTFFSLVQFNADLTGDGTDGDATVSATRDLNTDSLGASSDANGAYADGIAYRVAALSGSVVTASSAAPGLVAGDAALLINLEGTASDPSSVGNWEVVTVAGVSGAQVTLENAPGLDYDGAADDFSSQRVVLQRIPQYAALTVASGGVLTAAAYDGLSTAPSGNAGVRTGIVAVRVSGALHVDTGGAVDVSARGFSGGVPGTAAQGPIGTVTTGGGGGGGGAGGYDGWTTENGGFGGSGPTPGSRGNKGCSTGGPSGNGVGGVGGGGAGAGGNGGLSCGGASGAASPPAGTGSGGHGSHLAGGGGGGGRALDAAPNLTSTSFSRMGLGGGAAAGAGGGGGGAAHFAGGGGGGSGGGDGGDRSDNGGGGGGGGGAGGLAVGATGSKRGSTRGDENGFPGTNGTAGGGGGGAVLLWAQDATVRGLIRADGSAGGAGGRGGDGGEYVGGPYHGGGGGGGSGGDGATGGTVLLAASSLDLGANSISATGGPGGAGGSGGAGTSVSSAGASGPAGQAGDNGAIRLLYDTLEGASGPSAADPAPVSTGSFSTP